MSSKKVIYFVRGQQALEWFKTLSGQNIVVVGHATAECLMHLAYTGRSYTEFFGATELQNAAVREYVIE